VQVSAHLSVGQNVYALMNYSVLRKVVRCYRQRPNFAIFQTTSLVDIAVLLKIIIMTFFSNTLEKNVI
jgi:hypothetical protein